MNSVLSRGISSAVFAAFLLIGFAGFAQAAQPARIFLIFFDRGSTSIGAEGQAVIKKAEQAGATLRRGFVVVGYCDTSEPNPNGLSLARAKTIRALLMKFGAPAGTVSVRGAGTSNPMVPTGPNVPEPQNRRAVIAIQ